VGQGCGTPLKNTGCFAEETDVHTLIIAAAAFTVEVLLALVAGRFLHHCSQLADVAESKVIPVPQEDYQGERGDAPACH
jgi:hypothetical protein